MRLARPTTWIAIASAALVVALVWLDRDNLSPGGLAFVHAQDSRLADQDCELCHGDDRAGLVDACLECHAEIGAQLARRTGFHGTLDADARDCAACHSEHRGAELALVSAGAFARAGVADMARYDHARLGYALDGRHAALACADCHPHADVELLRQGDQRFLGLTQECASCHADVHDGKLPQCAACHGEEHPFAAAPLFEHTCAFALEDGHGGLACTRCHARGTEHAIEAEREVFAGVDDVVPRSCEECHASPHSTAFVAASARAQRVTPERSCALCHPTSHDAFAKAGGALTVVQHAWSGFALDAPHDTLACAQCHAAETPADGQSDDATFSAFRRAYPGRAASACEACHGDPHAADFARGPFAGAACTSCHAATHFLPSSFEIAQHARTALALDGAHAALACESCHCERRAAVVDGRERSLREFAGAPGHCAGCHADVHDALFDAAPPAGCERCHTTQAFRELARPFDHGRWTGFALDGAHARAACEVCHARTARPDADGRSFGRATVAAGVASASCESCHPDVHDGVFDRRGLALAVDGRASCERCHTQESFHDARSAEFDHARWTGFALDGAHAGLECVQCHEPLAEEPARTPRFGLTRGSACADCHVDVHAAQFADAGRTDCARCHTVQSDFHALSFDHQRDSRYALDDTHRPLDCGACHVPAPLPDGSVAVRYKPLGTACADCHVPAGTAR